MSSMKGGRSRFRSYQTNDIHEINTALSAVWQQKINHVFRFSSFYHHNKICFLSCVNISAANLYFLWGREKRRIINIQLISVSKQERTRRRCSSRTRLQVKSLRNNAPVQSEWFRTESYLLYNWFKLPLHS